jgi:hypothetical protein
MSFIRRAHQLTFSGFVILAGTTTLAIGGATMVTGAGAQFLSFADVISERLVTDIVTNGMWSTFGALVVTWLVGLAGLLNDVLRI